MSVDTTVGGTGQTAASGGRPPTAASLGRRLVPWAPTIVLLVLCVGITVLNPSFIEPRNLVRVANSASIPLILALGATFIIVMGSIDLSVEGVVALGATIVALLVSNDANSNEWSWAAPVLAVLAGGLLGCASGALHVYLRIPSFMTTLGVWFIGLGVANVMLGGSAVRILDPQIRDLALQRLFGLPFAVWIAVAAFLLAWLIQGWTRFGRHVFAIGGGEEIAAQAGVAVRRIRLMAFTLAGFFYGLGGVIAAAQLGQANAVVGDGRLFTTITAVVVGGTALTGGEGGVVNTLVGVLIVAVLANGMVLLGVSPYAQQAVQGLMIIVAVALSIDRIRLKIVK